MNGKNMGAWYAKFGIDYEKLLAINLILCEGIPIVEFDKEEDLVYTDKNEIRKFIQAKTGSGWTKKQEMVKIIGNFFKIYTAQRTNFPNISLVIISNNQLQVYAQKFFEKSENFYDDFKDICKVDKKNFLLFVKRVSFLQLQEQMLRLRIQEKINKLPTKEKGNALWTMMGVVFSAKKVTRKNFSQALHIHSTDLILGTDKPLTNTQTNQFLESIDSITKVYEKSLTQNIYPLLRHFKTIENNMPKDSFHEKTLIKSGRIFNILSSLEDLIAKKDESRSKITLAIQNFNKLTNLNTALNFDMLNRSFFDKEKIEVLNEDAKKDMKPIKFEFRSVTVEFTATQPLSKRLFILLENSIKKDNAKNIKINVSETETKYEMVDGYNLYILQSAGILGISLRTKDTQISEKVELITGTIKLYIEGIPGAFIFFKDIPKTQIS